MAIALVRERVNLIVFINERHAPVPGIGSLAFEVASDEFEAAARNESDHLLQRRRLGARALQELLWARADHLQ